MTTLLAARTQSPGSPVTATPASSPPVEKPSRLVSLDAYRGFIMLAMASGGFSLDSVYRDHFAGDPIWRWLAFQTSHVEWVGCSFWDLIQPSFMFMVGVAIPFSYASRKARGDSDCRILLHTIWRSVLLVLLGIFLTSTGDKQTNWIFPIVLCQIGLGYTFVYLLHGRGLPLQLLALTVILIGYWGWFALHPLPGPEFDYNKVGLEKWQEWLPGFFAHWDKNVNAAAAFDWNFLNLFPREKSFAFNAGGYQTLNFVPSIATMLLGLVAGEMLRGPKSRVAKFSILVAAGAVCLGLGLLAGETVCPIVKRIWTPSWALYSAGWTYWMLAGFYLVIDIWGWKTWTFPLVVVGMNSIAMYCMSQLLSGWIAGSLKIHFGQNVFEGTHGPIIRRAAVLCVLWFICLWLYRRKVFLRI